jgi:hypothetical protein
MFIQFCPNNNYTNLAYHGKFVHVDLGEYQTSLSPILSMQGSTKRRLKTVEGIAFSGYI